MKRKMVAKSEASAKLEKASKKAKPAVPAKKRLPEEKIVEVVNEWAEKSRDYIEKKDGLLVVPPAVLVNAFAHFMNDPAEFRKNVGMEGCDEKKPEHIWLILHGDDHFSFMHVYNDVKKEETLLVHCNAKSELHDKLFRKASKMLYKSRVIFKDCSLLTPISFEQESDWECGYLVCAFARGAYNYIRKNKGKINESALETEYINSVDILSKNLYK